MADNPDPWATHYPALKLLAGRGSDHKDTVRNKGTWCVWKFYNEESELVRDRMREKLIGYARTHGLSYEEKDTVVRVLIPWPEGGTAQERGKVAYRANKLRRSGRQFGRLGKEEG